MNAYGTANFASLSAARPYYVSMDDVRLALKEGAIHIGKPNPPAGHTVELRKGRYWLVQDAPRPTYTVERFDDPNYSRPRYRLRSSVRMAQYRDGYTHGSWKLKRDAETRANELNA